VKRLFLSVICVISVLSILVGVLAWMSWQTPAWYAPPDFSDPMISKLAERAEYRFNEELHKIRPETEIWAIRISDEAMNAWLAGRLEGWLTHDHEIDLPPEIHNPQVHSSDAGLWTYAEVEITSGNPRPLGVQWWVWVDEGNLFIEPIAIRLGKVPLPIALFQNIVEELREKVADVEAMIPLLDDRSVSVTHVEFEKGAVVLTCTTRLGR